jgi:AcrR family transcriptional regulator
MRRVQAVALDLFEARGFDRVSIEEIARAADVGPATVYRHFGTKERVVLWDEYDPLLLGALMEELPRHDVLEAAQRALSVSLSSVYGRDRLRILRRAMLIRTSPTLQAASAADMRLFRQLLAETLSQKVKDRLEAQVFAGALVATLEVAIEHWLEGGGSEPLSRLFAKAFRRLRRMSGPGRRASQ